MQFERLMKVGKRFRKPDVKYGEGIKSEEFVSEDNGCAC